MYKPNKNNRYSLYQNNFQQRIKQRKFSFSTQENAPWEPLIIIYLSYKLEVTLALSYHSMYNFDGY